MEKIKRGKFIVIDGTDGSGKATQANLLVKRLKRAGFSVEIADFPQYGQKSAGLVEEYLNGKYGDANSVGPYRASILYAVDRYDASFKIKKWLEEDKIVISNRYVTANMGHQGGKIENPLERKMFFSWLYKLEFDLFGIPKPDLNIILHVDAAVAQKLVDSKGDREYIGGKKRDIHEADLNHLRNAEKVYLEIAKTFPNFSLIKCTRNNEIMSKEEINNLLWEEVRKIINDKHLSEPRNEKSLNVERLSPTAKLPSRAHEQDAGLDLYSDDHYTLLPGDTCRVKTGIKMQIPKNHVGLIWDKSGLAGNGIHTLGGVIDADYRGEIIILIKNLGHDIFNIQKGQKIAQILIQKVELPKIVENKIEDETDRQTKAFGSTGLF